MRVSFSARMTAGDIMNILIFHLRVTRYGDGKGLRAVQLSWIPYFLNRAGKHDSISNNSKYAFYLTISHIDYLRSSTRMKYRIDRYYTDDVL